MNDDELAEDISSFTKADSIPAMEQGRGNQEWENVLNEITFRVQQHIGVRMLLAYLEIYLHRHSNN